MANTSLLGIVLCCIFAVVAAQNWAALEASISGEVFLPGDTEYDDIRDNILAYPADVDPAQPLAIVQPRSTEDVRLTIQFANDEGIAQVTALAGGHGADGFSFPSDGIQLDFSQMNSITVDSVAKTVTVEPGVIVGNVTQALAPFNLGHAQGNCNSLGTTGFLTYGGYGFWTRAEGLGIDTIVEYELVTANATTMTVNANTNPDLFFACRGALPAYGIATKIKLNVFDTTNFYGGRLFYAFDDLAVSTQALKDWFNAVYAEPDLIDDPNFNTRITFFNRVSFFPTFSRSITWTLEIIFLGPKTEAQKKAALLPVIDVDNVDFYPSYLDPTETQRLPMDYNTYNLYNFENSIQSFANLNGLFSHFRHGIVSDTRIRQPNVMNDLLDLYSEQGFDFNSFTTAFQLGEVSIAGGAMSDVDPADTAFFPREDFGFLWGYWTSFTSNPQYDAGVAYYDNISDQLTNIGQNRGFYGNLNTVRFGKEFDGLGTNLPRLEKIKGEYDPNNLFARSWTISTGVGESCIAATTSAIKIETGDKVDMTIELNSALDLGDLTANDYIALALYDENYAELALYYFDPWTNNWAVSPSTGTVEKWTYTFGTSEVKIDKLDTSTPRFKFKLMAAEYDTPDLPFNVPVYARVEIGNNEQCVDVTFATAEKSTSTKFEAEFN